ncbi:MAG TPA: hypothetical protein VJ905_03020, partial [Halalkalibaculum sp.]|nr:hypothetical protein [Halalkalibaculum sp.]
FTLVWVGSLPDWETVNNDRVTRFMRKRDSNGFDFYLSDDAEKGKFRLFLRDTLGNMLIEVFNNDRVNFKNNSVVMVVVTISRSSGEGILYVDGNTFGNVLDFSSITGSIDDNTPLYVSGYSGTRTASNTLAAYTYNYALNADQVKDLYYNGVAYEDRDGSMTEIYDSLAGGVNLTESPTGTITVDTADTVNDNRVIFTTTEVASDIANKNVSITFDCSVGGQYLLYLDDSWETSLDARDLEVGTNTISNLLLPSTGVICIKFITENTVVSNFSIVKAGTTLRLEPENIQLSPGQWLDAANGHHAKLPAEGTSLIRPQKEGFIEWTNTWSASSAGQYVSGINEDIFPSDKIRIEWIRFETETTGVNITLGDQSDTDRYVEATALVEDLDVSSPANRGHDGTNLQLVITPSETYTGSIKTTIKYTLI